MILPALQRCLWVKLMRLMIAESGRFPHLAEFSSKLSLRRSLTSKSKNAQITSQIQDIATHRENALKIEDDSEFQDLVLTVHHCYMHALMNTPSFKIIENHKGIAFVKMEIPVGIQQPQLMRINPIS
jgi:hypothetical protein